MDSYIFSAYNTGKPKQLPEAGGEAAGLTVLNCFIFKIKRIFLTMYLEIY